LIHHFSAAFERFKINTGEIRERIEYLKLRYEFSSLYEWDKYLLSSPVTIKAKVDKNE
jgi:hypothetical protein